MTFENALATLATHIEEWREDNDMGAISTYCPCCLARGGPPWAQGKREHKPDCRLASALALARALPQPVYEEQPDGHTMVRVR